MYEEITVVNDGTLTVIVSLQDSGQQWNKIKKTCGYNP